MTADTMLAWVVIGVAASLAGMVWPFRRGAAGVAVNMVAGAAGAIAAGLLSYLVLPSARPDSEPARLFFAALGALAALGLAHAAWTRRVHASSPAPPAAADGRRSGRARRLSS